MCSYYSVRLLIEKATPYMMTYEVYTPDPDLAIVFFCENVLHTLHSIGFSPWLMEQAPLRQNYQSKKHQHEHQHEHEHLRSWGRRGGEVGDLRGLHTRPRWGLHTRPLSGDSFFLRKRITYSTQYRVLPLVDGTSSSAPKLSI